MKKPLFTSLMLVSFLNFGQSLDSMKFVYKITNTKPTENIFEQQDRLRQNIVASIPKISKKELRYNLDKNKGNPSPQHPDSQFQQYILDPKNTRFLGQPVSLRIFGKKY